MVLKNNKLIKFEYLCYIRKFLIKIHYWNNTWLNLAKLW